MYETDNTKKYLIYIALSAIVLVGIVVLLGRMSFHTELEREVLPHTLIGYLDDETYFDTVTISDAQWPEWALAFDRPEEASVRFDNTVSGGHIGIFADLIYYENRYELRSWFSGKLIERASEYYYKPNGALYLEAVYAAQDMPEVPIAEIMPQQYDFMAFTGK